MNSESSIKYCTMGNNHVKTEPCPKCREEGNDTRGDNLSRYADGSSYCWKCGHYDLSNNIISKFLDRGNKPTHDRLPLVHLPIDVDINYPSFIIDWVGKYDLDVSDLLYNNVLYSNKGIKLRDIQLTDCLLFPFWDNERLIGYQCRVFGNGKDKVKWYSKGDVQNIAHVLFLGKVGHAKIKIDRLVFTEDLISAIKVSKIGICAMPIFGVHLTKRMAQIRVLNPLESIIFLDADMHSHSLKESNVMRLNGFKTHIILSKCDPKEYTYNELKEIL